MAAAYSTSTASSPSDLLGELNTFLAAQGWTIDLWTSEGSGQKLHAHKGSTYINLRSAMNEVIFPNVQSAASYGVGLYGGSGHTGGGTWDEEPGAPIEAGGTDTVGSFCRLDSGAVTAYHFFDDGSDNIIAVIERAGEIYTHFGFGISLTKAGSWTGGAYTFSALSSKRANQSNLNGDMNNHAGAPFAWSHKTGVPTATKYGNAGFVRADVDLFVDKWIGLSGDSTTGADGYTGKLADSGISYPGNGEYGEDEIPNFELLEDRLTSAFNAQTVLLPIRLYAQRDAGGWSLLGTVPRLFMSDGAGKGFNAAQVYIIDGKNYMMFPNFAVRKLA